MTSISMSYISISAVVGDGIHGHANGSVSPAAEDEPQSMLERVKTKRDQRFRSMEDRP